MSDNVNFAIVGCGVIGSAHARSIASIEGAHVTVACDSDPQIADFVSAIREGRPPVIDGRDGRRAVALIAAIYESARTGREVQLD